MNLRKLMIAALLISTATLFSAAHAHKPEKNMPKERGAQRVPDAEKRITALPDLTIGKVAVVDAFNVRLDVLNMGEVDAPDSIATIFIYDANNKVIETESTAVPALAPGPPVFVVFDDLGGDSGINTCRSRATDHSYFDNLLEQT